MPVAFDNRHPVLKIEARRIRSVLGRILKEAARPQAEVSISWVADAEIAALNAQWRGMNRPTDVLSFALDEDEALAMPIDVLGDIVVSLDAAVRQAAQVRDQLGAATYGLADEALFLCIHGILHLLGHDHQEPGEAEAMEALERRYLIGHVDADVHALDRTDHGLPAGPPPALGSPAAPESE